jgi:hypothetical protein
MMQLGKWYASREQPAKLFFPFEQTEDVALGLIVLFERVELKAMMQLVFKENYSLMEQNEAINKLVIKKIFQLTRGDFAYIEGVENR